MTDTCVQIVDGKRGGRNSNVLLNGFRYSKSKVNKNGSVIWACRVPCCKCTLTSGADLNVIRNPCPDHTYSTDAALLVNNMRKRAREKILPIPQIYEQERRKVLTTDLGAAPADIAQHLKLFNNFRSQLYRQRRYLRPQTPAAARNIRFRDEWCTTTTGDYFILIDDIIEGGSRIIVFGTLANLQLLYVVIVLYPWTAHSKWVLVCFISFTLSILIATIQCFQNFFVYYQINRQQHITVYSP